MKAVMRFLFGDKDTRLTWLALSLLLLAMFTPKAYVPHNTFSFIVVFDITQSMNVEDYELNGRPVSRLLFAQEAMRAALKQLPCGSRIGWGAFTEYRSLLLLAPLEVCENYNDLLASLENIDGSMRWRNASEVTKGLFWAARAANDEGSKANVLFLTDGHESPPLRKGAERPVFDDVAAGKIHGWVIGVGSTVPGRIPKIDADGKRRGFWEAEDVVQIDSEHARDPAGAAGEHLSGLREQHLQQLAQQVGFDYARLDGIDALLARIKDERYATRGSIPVDLFWLPALGALVVLAWKFRSQMPVRDAIRNLYKQLATWHRGS